jgi:hypothetical protein
VLVEEEIGEQLELVPEGTSRESIGFFTRKLMLHAFNDVMLNLEEFRLKLYLNSFDVLHESCLL